MNDREKIDLLTTNLNEKVYMKPKYLDNAKKLFEYTIPISHGDNTLWCRQLFVKIENKIYKYCGELEKYVRCVTSNIHPDCIYTVFYTMTYDRLSGYTIPYISSTKAKHLPIIQVDDYDFRNEKKISDYELGLIAEKIFETYGIEKKYVVHKEKGNITIRSDCTVFDTKMVMSTPVYEECNDIFTSDIFDIFKEYIGNVDSTTSGKIYLVNERCISEYFIENEISFKSNQLDYKCTTRSIKNGTIDTISVKERF